MGRPLSRSTSAPEARLNKRSRAAVAALVVATASPHAMAQSAEDSGLIGYEVPRQTLIPGTPGMPGGFHLMLMDLKGPLPKDSTLPLTLLLRDAKGVETRQEIQVPVSAVAPMHSH